MSRLRLIAGLVAALASAPLGLARGEVYKWVDENGVAHYTTRLERVPPHLRGRIGEPGSAQPAVRELVESAAAPADESLGAIPAPMRRRPPVPATIDAGPPDAPTEATPMPASAAAAPAASAALEPPAAAAPEPALPAPDAEPAAPPLSEPLASVESRPPELPSEEAAPAAPELAELERRIAQDRELIKTLISQTGSDGASLIADPRFRELSERLPRLQSELDALRDETAR